MGSSSTTGRLRQIKNKYWGKTAEEYEEGRRHSSHWWREQLTVAKLLQRARVGASDCVQDVPVGTGRFFPLYKRAGCTVIGVDASPDMITQARATADDLSLSDVTLHLGDITDLELTANTAEVSVCIRLMNWLDFSLFQRALSELRRTTSRYIIVGIRLSTEHVHFGDLFWLKEVFKAGKRSLKSVQQRVARSLQYNDDYEGDTGSGPSLVDHPEPNVKEEFRRQRLDIVEEEPVLLFRSHPRLSRFGAVEELPYRIFFLRV